MVSEKHSGVVITPTWVTDPHPSKVHWRPPIYNAEDYLGGLLNRGTPQTPPPHPLEMSLRQFQTVSDLLAKLSTDLRQAYPSFVQEFVCGGGVGQLLEVLRGVQVGQKPAARRQSLRDELHCLQALHGCLRCQDAKRRLTLSSTGLFTLAACIMSNVTKSRVLALEILGKACSEPGGHNAVSDAMSTMRLRFGEPVRFRFLCGMLSGACPQLLLAGLSFVNSFLESAPSTQARLYVQAELDQAGFAPQHFAKTITSKSPAVEEVRSELVRWHKLFVDVNKLRARENELCKEVNLLKDKVHLLEKRLQVLQEEKSVASSKECKLKTRCEELERQVSSLRAPASTPAEDEGISSSGQDDPEREPLVYELYTVNNDTILVDNKQDEDTTIEEVMEELQNIINDAESDYKQKEVVRNEKEETALARHYTKFMQRSTNDLTSSPYEIEIVPEKIHPYPPRRARSLYLEREYRYSMFFEDEDSADNSDSVLSSPPHEPVVVNYNTQHARRQGALLAKEAQKNFLKRRETFHNPSTQQEKVVTPSEILPHIKMRRGSFDGLFYQQESNSSKNSTKIYIEHDDSERIKAKSVEKLKDSQEANAEQEINCSKNNSSYYRQKVTPKKDDIVRYSSDRTVFLPIRNDPSPTSTQKFVVKRGLTNAGLYSGQHRDPAPTCRVNSCEYYSRSLGNLSHANLTVSSGKVTDLPSGLY